MSSKGCRVYIGNMPNGVRERDLESFFKKFGKPNDFLIKAGFGFVEFDDYRDADDAVYELNGKVENSYKEIDVIHFINILFRN